MLQTDLLKLIEEAHDPSVSYKRADEIRGVISYQKTLVLRNPQNTNIARIDAALKILDSRFPPKSRIFTVWNILFAVLTASAASILVIYFELGIGTKGVIPTQHLPQEQTQQTNPENLNKTPIKSPPQPH